MIGEEMVGMANWGATPLGLVEASSLSIQGAVQRINGSCRSVSGVRGGIGSGMDKWRSFSILLWYTCMYMKKDYFMEK